MILTDKERKCFNKTYHKFMKHKKGYNILRLTRQVNTTELAKKIKLDNLRAYG